MLSNNLDSCRTGVYSRIYIYWNYSLLICRPIPSMASFYLSRMLDMVVGYDCFDRIYRKLLAAGCIKIRTWLWVNEFSHVKIRLIVN